MSQLKESNFPGFAFLSVEDLGLISHEQAYEIQKQRLNQVLEGGKTSLLLCEHPFVITLGRSSDVNNVLLSHEQIEAQGGKIVSIDRGGDVTLHAPGQLVVYPIMDLRKFGKDLKLYLNKLEQVAIDLLASFDIVAGRFLGRTGVWIADKKIASIGIGVKKWTSYHGVGLNVSTDLKFFSVIRPCGMDVKMTSIAGELGKEVSMRDVKKEFLTQFIKHFFETEQQ